MSVDPDRRGPPDQGQASRVSERQEWELELPSFAALGTLATVLLPHLPLLHGALVLLQLSVRSTRDDP